MCREKALFGPILAAWIDKITICVETSDGVRSRLRVPRLRESRAGKNMGPMGPMGPIGLMGPMGRGERLGQIMGGLGRLGR